jgi:hypothetical protein
MDSHAGDCRTCWDKQTNQQWYVEVGRALAFVENEPSKLLTAPGLEQACTSLQGDFCHVLRRT